jgi:hypothetical protein
MTMGRASRTAFAALALGALLVTAAPAIARGRTCTVDLDDVMAIRKEVIDLARNNLHVDKGRAEELRRKYGDALKGGAIDVDPKDFKGVFSMKGKPSAAAIKDLLARLETIIASCHQ